MQILSATSAFPKHYYPQQAMEAALEHYWSDQLPNPQVLRRLHAQVGVEGRHLALPIEEYPNLKGWGEANDHWIRTAQELGECAIRRAAVQAGLDVRDLSAFFFTSVTGISSPSIEARLINRMGLSPGMKRIPIFGLGCVAGAAGIARAADYVKAYPGQTAVLLSVELCSLTLQRGDLSMANLISAGLFGDGAAAVVIGGSETASRGGPKILATRSIFYPDTEEMMGWNVSERGFEIVLSREVPNLIRQRLAQDVDAFLEDHACDRSDIGSWVLHTGGPKVLDAIADALEFKNGELKASWDCLRRVGNLSSASVLVVLEDVMKNRRPAPGTLGLLAAMGPGFCSELVLLQW
jgi:alkylresorcinol/alkylpyrone synthase